jgi:hypothetical protein
LVDRVELEDSRDGVTVVVPGGQVVSKPFSDTVAGSGKGGTSDNERTLSGTTGFQGVVGCGTHRGSVEVVDIVFDETVLMDNVGVHSTVGQTEFNVVVDGVGRGDVVLAGGLTSGELSESGAHGERAALGSRVGGVLGVVARVATEVGGL